MYKNCKVFFCSGEESTKEYANTVNTSESVSTIVENLPVSEVEIRKLLSQCKFSGLAQALAANIYTSTKHRYGLMIRKVGKILHQSIGIVAVYISPILSAFLKAPWPLNINIFSIGPIFMTV